MSNQIVLPRILQIGAGASKEIGNIIEGLGCSKPLIVTDKMMMQLGYVNRIQERLPASDVYDDTVPEPTEASILAGVKKVQQGDYDCIIAIGGGSPIDSAKAISVLGKNGGGRLNVSSKSTSAAVGIKPIPMHSIFSSTFSSVMMVTLVTSDPVPAVVGMATMGNPGSLTIRGTM